MTPSLSDTFAPPSTTTYGPLRVVGEPAEHLGLGGDEAAGVVRQPLRDVEDAGVLAVDGAEAVADVGVGEAPPAGPRRRHARRRPCDVSAASKRRFSSSATSPSPRPATTAVRGLPRRVGGEGDGPAEQLREAAATGASESSRLRLALGPPEVGAHHDPRPGVGQRLDGGEAGPDPPVVGDDPRPVGVVGQRDVEVGPDEDAPTSHPLGEEVVESAHRLEGRADVGDEVDEAVGVAPLVVVPADDLDLVAARPWSGPRRRCTTRGSVTMSDETIGSSV